MSQHEYRAVKPGVERTAPGLVLPRHRHRAGYATVVLGGALVEASFAGRFEVQPGDALLHGRFDCHQNVATSRGGRHILRLPWTDDFCEGLYRVDDADGLVRLSENRTAGGDACARAATAIAAAARDALVRTSRIRARRRRRVEPRNMVGGSQSLSRNIVARLSSRIRRDTEVISPRSADTTRVASRRQIVSIAHRDRAGFRLC